MKKLEDIPKQDFFKAPDGYFDKLPLSIMEKVSKQETRSWVFSMPVILKLAVPIILVGIGLIWYVNSIKQIESTETLLASIQTNALIDYMEESDMTTEDFLETLDFTTIHADSLDLNNSNIILEDEDLTDALAEFETEL